MMNKSIKYGVVAFLLILVNGILFYEVVHFIQLKKEFRIRPFVTWDQNVSNILERYVNRYLNQNYQNENYILLTFINPRKTYHHNHVRGLQKIKKKFWKDVLVVLVISQQKEQLVNYFKEIYEITLPFIYDKELLIHYNFGLPSGSEATILINRQTGKVEFAYNYLIDELLLEEIIGARLK